MLGNHHVPVLPRYGSVVVLTHTSSLAATEVGCQNDSAVSDDDFVEVTSFPFRHANVYTYLCQCLVGLYGLTRFITPLSDARVNRVIVENIVK